tara:strand:+ start:3767 stop:4795 length:1029 start_codon:yes stop_codon:yes gene_type:complete
MTTKEIKNLPEEIYGGTGNDEEDFVLVKNIPIRQLVMLKSQGEAILRDIDRGELSQTEGLPILFYDIDKKQLIVDDGNHRIFQKYLSGEDTIDALVYSSEWHSYLRPVYSGEEVFDWDTVLRSQTISDSLQKESLCNLNKWLIKNNYLKESAMLKDLSSDVTEDTAREMEELELEYFPSYWQNAEDILDDMKQPGVSGVVYVENESNKVKGYLYGYQLVYEDELADSGRDLEDLTCFTEDCYDDVNAFAEDMLEKAKDGEIFYVSNFLIDKRHRFKIVDIINEFLEEVRSAGYQYISFDALSDTYRLLMKGDKPNASREQKFGITVLGKIDTMFIASVDMRN